MVPGRLTRGNSCQYVLFPAPFCDHHDFHRKSAIQPLIWYMRKAVSSYYNYHSQRISIVLLQSMRLDKVLIPKTFKQGCKCSLEMLSLFFLFFFPQKSIQINYCIYLRAQYLLCGRWPRNIKTAVNIKESTSPWKASRWIGALH